MSQTSIPRGPIETEPLDLWREHRGEDLRKVAHTALRGAFVEAGLTGLQLGAHDARIAAWLGNMWELSTVATIASWVVRAYDAGRAAEPDQPADAPQEPAAGPVDQPAAETPDQPLTARQRAYTAAGDALAAADRAVALWCDEVRQDVVKRRDPTDERVWHDPEYGAALDVHGLATRARKSLIRVHRNAVPAPRPRFDVADVDQPEPDQPRTSPPAAGDVDAEPLRTLREQHARMCGELEAVKLERDALAARLQEVLADLPDQPEPDGPAVCTVPGCSCRTSPGVRTSD